MRIEKRANREQLIARDPAYLSNLSVLRVILGVTIVFYHLPSWTAFQRSLYVDYFYLFNDFFFCLSGYLMFHNFISREQFSNWWGDVFKRFMNLYPLHFILLCAWTVISISEVPLANLFGLDRSTQNNNTPKNFVLNLLFIQGWQINSVYSFNHPAWVFSVLWLCYIVARLIFLIRNKILIAGIVFSIVIMSLMFMLNSDASSAHGFSVPRVFLNYFMGGALGLMSRVTQPGRILTVFSSLFALSSIPIMFYYFGETTSFFVFVPISLSIWLLSRKRGSISLSSKSQSRLLYFDRLTFALMISHSVPILIMEHLCLVIVSGPIEKQRGTKYIELSDIQGLFFILTSMLFSYAVAVFMHKLDRAIKQSKFFPSRDGKNLLATIKT